MARATASKAKLQFNSRYYVRLAALCEAPAIRGRVETLCNRWGELHEAGYDPRPRVTETPERGVASPLFEEIAFLRARGIQVSLEEREGRPVVDLSLSHEVAQEGLAARLVYPQDLLSGAEYDLWEIRRDAPVSRILADLQVQKLMRSLELP